MSDELPSNLRPIVDFFGLPGTAAVAKDFHDPAASEGEGLNRVGN